MRNNGEFKGVTMFAHDVFAVRLIPRMLSHTVIS